MAPSPLRILLPLPLLAGVLQAQAARVANLLPTPAGSFTYGRTIVGLGDVSVPPDGMADFAIGDPAGPGLLEVRSGAAGNPLIWSVTGTQANEQLGFGLATVPDLTGDGVDDIACGAPSFNGPGASGEGRLTYFDATNGALISTTTGGFVNASLGAVLCRTNDLQGDGIDDLLVFRHRPGANEVLLLKGGDASLGIAMVIPGFSAGINDLVMSAAGDWDGDGLEQEFALANPVLGSVRILNVASGTALVLVEKLGTIGLGASMAPMRDPAGGSALVVGDTGAAVGGIPFGAVHLLTRGAGMSTLVPASVARPGVGQSISVADLDLDGDMNILVSANDAALNAEVLVFDSQGALQQTFLSPTGIRAQSVAVVGDQSGDGMPELCLSRMQVNTNTNAVEVLFGGNAASMDPAYRPGSTNSVLPIPPLTLSAPPVLGSSVTLTMTGALGQASLGIILFGAPLTSPIVWNGVDLFVGSPEFLVIATIPANLDLSATGTVPANLALLGLPIAFQAIEFLDPSYVAASNTIRAVLGW